MAIKYITDEKFKKDAEGKIVLARFDFNVPMDKKNPTHISDTTRIDEAVASIQYILNCGVKKLVLMSHFGRPNGKVDLKYSLEPVATYLASLLKQDVILTETALDGGIKTLLHINEAKIILLQNLRFHPEEENNDQEFARKLASYGDVFVFDAFGAAHRKHASTYAINSYFKNKAYGGILIEKEINALTKVLNKPAKPFVAIIGGAKVSDKIKLIEILLSSVDQMIIGGAMAYPFLKADGVNVGASLANDEDVVLAKKILSSPMRVKLKLPMDHNISDSLNGELRSTTSREIPDGFMGLDIGPLTLNYYKGIIEDAKTIIWNGPMGYFENPTFSKGTIGIAKIIGSLAGKENVFSLVGGGDSVSAVRLSKEENHFSHISTGGGATLEFIENGSLPGVNALKFGID